MPNDVVTVTTSVILYELSMGAKTVNKVQDLDNLLIGVDILPFDEQAVRKAAEIYHKLRLSNKMIEFRDIFIAAICIVNNLELVTLNTKHFERIDELNLLLP